MGQERRSSARGQALVGMKIEGSVQTSGQTVSPRAPRLNEVAVASLVHHPRGDIVSPYDARYASVRPSDLAPLIDRLVTQVDLSSVDLVLAISDSGVLPAFAFASRVDLPLVVATDVEAELPQAIAFEIGHGSAPART